MPNSLIFIGERPSHLELKIKGKPDFYDAILLSKKFDHVTNLSYHSIPLTQSRVTIHIRETNSQFNCHHRSMQLIEGERLLSEDEAYNIFTNFAIMEDNKVAFLMHPGRKNIKLQEKENPKKLSAHERMEV